MLLRTFDISRVFSSRREWNEGVLRLALGPLQGRSLYTIHRQQVVVDRNSTKYSTAQLTTIMGLIKLRQLNCEYNLVSFSLLVLFIKPNDIFSLFYFAIFPLQTMHLHFFFLSLSLSICTLNVIINVISRETSMTLIFTFKN